ncbi:hypothetical protein RHMOL_Rhmol02G0128400 [Rhododendron molle]|uniref:Uncharacterized protein n=1 Tax=Rhododendron molle TaxID=49168 RepID=A0ACC0PPV3_RHOML|nr:hypothetical protein RHMOL_Rhmol02G0128400 [Rhododendron molle]
MEYMLSLKELYDPIEHKGKRLDSIKVEECNKSNRKTVVMIRQFIGQEVFQHVAQETDAYVLWVKLVEMYQLKSSRNKALLMRQLVNLKLRSGDLVAVHSSEFQSLVKQLSSVGLDFDDELQALLLLSSLPDDWEVLVVSLSNSV